MNTALDSKIVKTFIVAGVLISKDNKYLLVQEKQSKAYGLWNWPGGKVEIGYSIEDTAIKEAKEECGYDVKLIEEVGVYHEHIKAPVQHLYKAEIVGGELSYPEDEIINAKWFSYQEILHMKDKLRGSWILSAVEKLENIRNLT